MSIQNPEISYFLNEDLLIICESDWKRTYYQFCSNSDRLIIDSNSSFRSESDLKVPGLK
ncbi:hypothetical protein Pan161_08520 [Gimesia algae]|uniref:Uncharacterized protein n=1 Tax=Gimesia algae TaxID=2527971 RepID=A0A517V892_9PLAN|nr:hypothetical protein Pan161_08520 [Gimesia algae]